MTFLRPSFPPGPGRAEALLAPHALQTYALVVFGACGLFIGHPNPFLYFPLLALAFPFSLHLLATLAPSGKKALLYCWTLGLFSNTAGLYWLIHPMHDVGGLDYALAWPAVMLLSAFLACYPALAGLSMRRVRQLFSVSEQDSGFPVPSFFAGMRPALSLPFRLVPAALLSGCIYAGYEVLCGFLFTGFPWLALGSAFAFWPDWIQAASLVGGYGLGACFAAAACLAASAALAASWQERVGAVLLALALIAALPVYGHFRLAKPLPENAGAPLSIMMVQGNIDQNQKWDPAFQEATLAHYLDMSQRALDDARATHPESAPALVLWPETAMPFYFQAHAEYAGRLRRFAADNNVNLGFGALGVDRDPDDPRGSNQLFNRLYLLSSQGRVTGAYDKQHLVPFGEYIPFASSLTFLRNIVQGLDFSPGFNTKPLLLVRPEAKPDPLADAPLPPDGKKGPEIFTPYEFQPERPVSLGVLICYEVIFPSLAQERVKNGATMLVTVSNDGWFGQSSAPLQHLGLTTMRAVEQARPIARATNTGYTVAIDSRGRITERNKHLFTDETLFATLRPSDETTVYHRIHPLPEAFLLFCALCSFPCFFYWFRQWFTRNHS